MSAIYKRGRAEMEANLTSLIDVVFLLIVFFVLVSRIVDIESADMNLPRPENPRTERMTEIERVVINVVPRFPGSTDTVSYRVGAAEFAPTPQGVEAMTGHLAALYQQNASLRINLRADGHAEYSAVEPAMTAIVRAAALAGRPDVVPRVNLVVERE